MIWLLTEILVFVLAAFVFGGLIGLGLGGGTRRAAPATRDHRALQEQLQQVQGAQRAIEAKAQAVSAAEAAARGDLETRLLAAEAGMAEFRARAESAELRLRALQAPADAAPLPAPDTGAADAEAEILRAAVAAAEQARGRAEAEQRQAEEAREAAIDAAAKAREDARGIAAVFAQEIESLRVQLVEAERIRARTEAALASAEAKPRPEPQPAAPRSDAPRLDMPGPTLPRPEMRGGEPPPRMAAPMLVPQPAPAPTLLVPAQPALGWGEPAAGEGDRPVGLAAPRGGRPDDLRRIKGIGPKNEGVLNSLGIYHYDQIAALSAGNVAWLDAFLKFHGRIAREDWVGQAKTLVRARAQPMAESKVHPDDAGA